MEGKKWYNSYKIFPFSYAHANGVTADLVGDHMVPAGTMVCQAGIEVGCLGTCPVT
jgi:hypothetical protein